MNYRALGGSGLRVSEIGFGTWGLGGNAGGAVSYGPADDRESIEALHQAFDLGITFYDTADLYGFGHSEKLLGEAFAHRRDKVIIASKVGFLDAARQDFSATHIREALEQSLRRLRSDYVDLYQLHSPPVSLLREQPAVLTALEKLKSAGKIRAWGVSARSPEEARVAAGEFDAPCVQVNFNLTDQRARTGGLFELCRERRVGIIVRTPLCFGFLTGKYGDSPAFDTTDHRSRWSPEQVQSWQQANDAFQFLFESNPADTPAQLALRYCLSFEAVSTVIPGMLTAAHVRENAAASHLGPLPVDQVEHAAQVCARTEFFIRPR